MNNSRVLVIVPTYNERENLAALVEAILTADSDLHLLIVDDNSPDGTGDLAETLAQAHQQAHVLHRPGKAGLGALRTARVLSMRWRRATSSSSKWMPTSRIIPPICPG